MKVSHNIAEHRFETALPDGSIAAIYYRIDDEGRFVMVHTEVPPKFTGRGIATQLATGAFDLTRQSSGKAILRCPFLQAFYRDHPQYSDIVAG